jgi:hypothetical protein
MLLLWKQDQEYIRVNGYLNGIGADLLIVVSDEQRYGGRDDTFTFHGWRYANIPGDPWRWDDEEGDMYVVTNIHGSWAKGHFTIDWTV